MPELTLNFKNKSVGKYQLQKGLSLTIGRREDNDIVIKGLLVDPTSATIRREPDGCYLSYISGLTRPKVNEKPVTGSILLKDSDIIEIGSVRLQFSNEPAPE